MKKQIFISLFLFLLSFNLIAQSSYETVLHIEVLENDFNTTKNFSFGYVFTLEDGPNGYYEPDDNINSFFASYRMGTFGEIYYHLDLYNIRGTSVNDPKANSFCFFNRSDLVFTKGFLSREKLRRNYKFGMFYAEGSGHVNVFRFNEIRFGHMKITAPNWLSGTNAPLKTVFIQSNIIQFGIQKGSIHNVDYSVNGKRNTSTRRFTKYYYLDFFYAPVLTVFEESKERYRQNNGNYPITENKRFGGRVGFIKRSQRLFNLGLNIEMGYQPSVVTFPNELIYRSYLKFELFLPVVSFKVPTPSKFHF